MVINFPSSGGPKEFPFKSRGIVAVHVGLIVEYEGSHGEIEGFGISLDVILVDTASEGIEVGCDGACERMLRELVHHGEYEVGGRSSCTGLRHSGCFYLHARSCICQ